MRWMMVALAGLAGCSGGGETVPSNATAIEPAPAPTSSTISYGSPKDWTGRWTGVEGMVLDIAPGSAAGRYRLTMQWDLDHRGTFDGILISGPEEDAMLFRREGRLMMLRPTIGEATGLKYLAGKTDCLTVKSGEGYCRD